MTLRPYYELIAMAKEKIDEALAPLRANTAKQKAKLKIAELEEKMASQESRIYELCVQKDIDFDKIISAQDEYALMERRKKQLDTIIEQLFPEK